MISPYCDIPEELKTHCPRCGCMLTMEDVVMMYAHYYDVHRTYRCPDCGKIIR